MYRLSENLTQNREAQIKNIIQSGVSMHQPVHYNLPSHQCSGQVILMGNMHLGRLPEGERLKPEEGE